MTKKQKKMLVRIIISFIILAGEMIFFHVSGVDIGIWELVAYLVPYLIIGYDILRKAWKGICNHQVFDENFLMAVATIGAIALAIYEKSGDYAEAVAVMLFYQIGELFQINQENQSPSLWISAPIMPILKTRSASLKRLTPRKWNAAVLS